MIITESVMRIPRCGVVDMAVVGGGAVTEVEDSEVEADTEDPGEERLLRRHKRYALHGSRWKTKTLTYRVSR